MATVLVSQWAPSNNIGESWDNWVKKEKIKYQSSLYKNFSEQSDYINFNEGYWPNKGIKIMVDAIKKIKNKDDFPVYIDYNWEDFGLPRVLDIRREKEKSQQLLIRLDNRVFSIEPLIGTISDVIVKDGSISIKIWRFEKVFTPLKLTELILKVHAHKGWVGSRFSMKGVNITEIAHKN